MKVIAISLIFFYIAIPSFSQGNRNNKIVGIVYEKNSDPKVVIKNASVAIPGVGTATSDQNGTFAIGLSQCQNCIAGKSLKIYVNSDYGYGEMEYVIPSDPNLKACEIAISPNRKLSIHGIVTGKPGASLGGIMVRAIIQNYDQPINPVYTDKSGYFNLIIRKDGIGSMQAIQLLFSDDKNEYQSMEKVVFINQFEPVKVELIACQNCGSKDTVRIYRSMVSNISVEEGDLVKLEASGFIRVGDNVGNSGPEGIPNNRGVAGFSLQGYNYFPNWNHGVLAFRVGPKDEWKCYQANKENVFQASQTGAIEFIINDVDESNNSGYYTVIINIKK